MSAHSTRFWLLLFVTVIFISAVGCAQNVNTGNNTSSDDEIRAALQPPLRALQAGHPEQALQMLVGHTLDAAVWKRTEKTMSAHYARSGLVEAQQCADNLKQLADAIELYRAEESHGYQLPVQLKNLIGERLTQIPTCPSAGKDTYSAAYQPDRRGETYVLACSGHHHATAGLRSDSPRYEPRFGVRMDMDERFAWWPAGYQVNIESIDRVASRATVKLREVGRSKADLRLRLRANEEDGKIAWVIDSERFADDGGSDLGLLLGTYFTAISATPPAQVASSRSDCERQMRRLATALEMYSSEHAGRYPRQLSELIPHYLPTVPVCSSDQGDVSPRYQLSTDGENYELTCGGQHPDIHLSNRPEGARDSDARVGSAYPPVNSATK